MPSTDDAGLAAKVTNLTGLEYATNLAQIQLPDATIETHPVIGQFCRKSHTVIWGRSTPRRQQLT